MKIIINADDCGKDVVATEHIRQAILQNKISSTTIMSNMQDFEGAIKLYKDCVDCCSFGCHLNLTEGSPLRKSQLLLDQNILIERNGITMLNGRCIREMKLSRETQNELFLELSLQVSKLLDSGVRLSHFDSHHFIHTSANLMGVMARLTNKYRIYKIRRARNWVHYSIDYLKREVWYYLSMIYNSKYQMTNFFGSFEEFISNPSLHNLNNQATVELMCHPGHSDYNYQKEEEDLYKISLPNSAVIINYNQL